MSKSDRIKYTLRALFTIFDHKNIPNFGDNDWVFAQMAMEKRDLLMHPESTDDLLVTDEDYRKIHAGFTWLVDQHMYFAKLMNKLKSKSNAKSGADKLTAILR